MKRLLLALLVLSACLGAAFLYIFGDAERLRVPLQEYFSERAGLPVRIEGELAWQLFPPLQLSITQLSAGAPTAKRHGGLERVALRIAPWSAIRAPQDPRLWTLRAFTLENLHYTDGPRRYDLVKFAIHNLKDRTPAPFSASLTYDDGRVDAADPESNNSETLDLQGSMLIATSELSLKVSDVALTGSLADGTCGASFALQPNNTDDNAGSNKDDLVPVADLQETRWELDCVLANLRWRDESFTDVTWFSTNNTGATQHRLTIAEFFGGTAQFDLGIDASGSKVRWQIEPTLTDVRGDELLAWFDRRSRWRGPINLDGQVSFRGNSAAAFLFTAKGELNVSSTNGMLDLRDVKTQVAGLGRIMGGSASVDEWPDDLNYQNFSAHWVMQGAEHQIAALLDNLKMSAAGNYQIVADQMDVAAELTFVSNADPKPLKVNSLLEDLPIPMRCQGSLAAPTCRIDEGAGRDLLGDILTGGGSGGSLREKIEEVIDEEVPEQFRDAARQLLDLLGDSLRAEPQDEASEGLPDDPFDEPIDDPFDDPFDAPGTE